MRRLIAALRCWWLRMTIDGLEQDIDELDIHAKQFREIIEHKAILLNKKRRELSKYTAERFCDVS